MLGQQFSSFHLPCNQNTMRFYIINGVVPLLASRAYATTQHNGSVVVDDDIDVPSKDEADAGILSKHTLDDFNSSESDGIFLRSPSPSLGPSISKFAPDSNPPNSGSLCPANNYIICVNGFNDGISCATACNGQCCIGPDACTGFTGKICRDGSCNGFRACTSSSVQLVVNSCKSSAACAYAGREGGGTVGQIVNSCSEQYACYKLGWNGFVGNVLDSCHGLYACQNGGSSGGSIASITRSCNNYQACFVAGVGSNGGILTDMRDCCNSYNGCNRATELPAYCRSSTDEGVYSSLAVETA